jgi:hypothetical protein
MEFDVFSLPLPDVAAEEVVQLVSCFSLDGVVDWATAGPTSNQPAKNRCPDALDHLVSLANEKIVFVNHEQNVPEREKVPRIHLPRPWSHPYRRAFHHCGARNPSLFTQNGLDVAASPAPK